MNRNIKRIILLISDILLIIGSLLFSFSLRLGEWYFPPGGLENYITWLIIFAPIIAVPIFIFFGLYRAIIRYLGMQAVWSVTQAVTLYGLIWGLIAMISNFPGVPRSVVVINFLVTLLFIGGSRMLARYILRLAESFNLNKNTVRDSRIRMLIYGAGAAGKQLAAGINQSIEYKLCGFIDDQKYIQGRELEGVSIISRAAVKSFVDLQNITDIFLAIPSVSTNNRNEILKSLLPLPVRIKSLPSLSRLTKGSPDLSDIQELEIDDLLMRDSTVHDEYSLKSLIQDKVVLVTGAGGSIGGEICHQVLRRNPKIILLFEVSEYALYSVHQKIEELCLKYSDNKTIIALPRVIPVLGSIQDESRLTELLQTWKTDIIFHAAAYKHVPMVESNLSEGIKNNVFGTLKLAKVAIEQHVDKFVLISTDKAVNPTNGMGASKRVAEMILQALSSQRKVRIDTLNNMPTEVLSNTEFKIVRFGNVLGSSGSVVPLFRKQIKNGGPLTLTHKDITRYFMTIEEAAQLVIHSAAMESNTNSAEVFVLDMGKPVNIMQLAEHMIKLSGLKVKDKNNPNGDIEIITTGLRPGEKLYEELLIGNNPKPTSNKKILKAEEHYMPWLELQEKLNELQIAADNNNPEVVIYILKRLVSGYTPEKKITELIYRENQYNSLI